MTKRKGKPKVKGFKITSSSGLATFKVRNIYTEKQARKLGKELAALGTMLLRDFGQYAGDNVVVKEVEINADGATVRDINPNTSVRTSEIIKRMFNDEGTCLCGEKH